MYDAEMEETVKALVNEPRFDELVPFYLDMAKKAVASYLFPYRDDVIWEDVPEKHHMATCQIAVYLINKRGAEGETQHIESGVSRTYQSAAIPRGFFSGMVPFVGVPRSCATSTETDDQSTSLDSAS